MSLKITRVWRLIQERVQDGHDGVWNGTEGVLEDFGRHPRIQQGSRGYYGIRGVWWGIREFHRQWEVVWSETFGPPSACTDRGCTLVIQPAAVSEPGAEDDSTSFSERLLNIFKFSSINTKAPSSSSQSHDTSVDTPGLPVHTWTSCAWEDLISDQLTAGSGLLIVDFYYVWWVKGLWFIWSRCSVVNVPHVLHIHDVPYSGLGLGLV